MSQPSQEQIAAAQSLYQASADLPTPPKIEKRKPRTWQKMDFSQTTLDSATTENFTPREIFSSPTQPSVIAVPSSQSSMESISHSPKISIPPNKPSQEKLNTPIGNDSMVSTASLSSIESAFFTPHSLDNDIGSFEFSNEELEAAISLVTEEVPLSDEIKMAFQNEALTAEEIPNINIQTAGTSKEIHGELVVEKAQAKVPYDKVINDDPKKEIETIPIPIPKRDSSIDVITEEVFLIRSDDGDIRQGKSSDEVYQIEFYSSSEIEKEETLIAAIEAKKKEEAEEEEEWQSEDDWWALLPGDVGLNPEKYEALIIKRQPHMASSTFQDDEDDGAFEPAWIQEFFGDQ